MTLFIWLTISLLLLCKSSPAGWSEDIRITFSGEKGGAGLFIRKFHIDQDGNYYFVGYNEGQDVTFLSKVDKQGNLLINEKNLLARFYPLFVLFDKSNYFYIFHGLYAGDPRREFACSKFDKGGEKLNDSIVISDIDMWESTEPTALIDNSGNLAVLWKDLDTTSSEAVDVGRGEVMYKKLDISCRTLEKKSILKLNYLDRSSIYADESKFYIFLPKEKESPFFYYYAIDANSTILQDKTYFKVTIPEIPLPANLSRSEWVYRKFMFFQNKIHLFIIYYAKFTTLKGQFIKFVSYIYYVQYSRDGKELSRRYLFPPTDGSIIPADFSVAINNNRRIHLAWTDGKDYNPVGGGGPGLGLDFPMEIYYLILNENGEPLVSQIRLTELDNKDSKAPNLYVKDGYVFLVWSDNRNYKGGAGNGYDIFLKSTASLGFNSINISKPFIETPLGMVTVGGAAILIVTSLIALMRRRGTKGRK